MIAYFCKIFLTDLLTTKLNKLNNFQQKRILMQKLYQTVLKVIKINLTREDHLMKQNMVGNIVKLIFKIKS